LVPQNFNSLKIRAIQGVEQSIRVLSAFLQIGWDPVCERAQQDSFGSVALIFQGRSSVPGIERGTRLLVRGTVTSLRREAVILNPQYEIVAAPHGDE